MGWDGMMHGIVWTFPWHCTRVRSQSALPRIRTDEGPTRTSGGYRLRRSTQHRSCARSTADRWTDAFISAHLCWLTQSQISSWTHLISP
jgi:hypothetical protein